MCAELETTGAGKEFPNLPPTDKMKEGIAPEEKRCWNWI
jgi:hypothetical protein